MWLVAHETYAQSVYLDGRNLTSDDFKPQPEGHTGALNSAPTRAIAINAITATPAPGSGQATACRR
jgi:hypothetical protein